MNDYAQTSAALPPLPALPSNGIEFPAWRERLMKTLQDRNNLHLIFIVLERGQYITMNDDARFTLDHAVYAEGTRRDPDRYPEVAPADWLASEARKTNQANRTKYKEQKDAAFRMIENLIPPERLDWLPRVRLGALKADGDFIGLLKLIEDMVVRNQRDTFAKILIMRMLEPPLAGRTLDQFITEVGKDYRALKHFYDLPPSMDGIIGQALIACLPEPMQDFRRLWQEKRSGRTPDPIPLMLQEIREYATMRGIEDSTPMTVTPQRTQLERQPQTALVAASRTTKPKAHKQINTNSGNRRCDRCGELGHDKRDCKEEHVFCDTCHKEGKAAKVFQGHSTKAHRGPRRFTGKKTQGLIAAQSDQNFDDGARYAWQIDPDEQDHEEDFDHCNIALVTEDAHPEDDAAHPQFASLESFDEIKIPADGNCFFASIARATGYNTQDLRDIAADCIINADGPKLGLAGMTVKDYLLLDSHYSDITEAAAAVRRHAYGGTIELVLLSEALGLNFTVWTSRLDAPSTLAKAVMTPTILGAASINLRFHAGHNGEGGNHYNLLLPRAKAQPPLTIVHREHTVSWRDIVKQGVNRKRERNSAPSRPQGPPPILAFVSMDKKPTTSHAKARTGNKKPKTPQARAGNNTVILDTGATAHVLSGETNARRTGRSKTVMGVGGAVTKCQQAEHPTLGEVLVLPTKGQNSLISFSRLDETHDIKLDKDAFIARNKHEVLVFKKKDGLYILEDPCFALASVDSVDNNEEAIHADEDATQPEQPPSQSTFDASAPRTLTAAQRRALGLHEAMHHPSDDSLMRSIKEGAIINVGCTANDLKEARAIVGPCEACIMGKTTRPPSPPSTSRIPALGTTIHVDIMDLSDRSHIKAAFLIAVEEVSSMVASRRLFKRTTDEYTAALLQITHDLFVLSGIRVTRIRIDGERALVQTRSALAAQGIDITLVPPERHVSIAERAIREIRNYARCTLAKLPFQLAGELIDYLIADIVAARNAVSHHRRPVSPRFMLQGKAVDANKDFRFTFGTIGHCRKPDLATKNKLLSRTELCVIVGRTIGEAGAVHVWLPRTRRVVLRSHFIPIKVTPSLLADIRNAMGHPGSAGNNSLLAHNNDDEITQPNTAQLQSDSPDLAPYDRHATDAIISSEPPIRHIVDPFDPRLFPIETPNVITDIETPNVITDNVITDTTATPPATGHAEHTEHLPSATASTSDQAAPITNSPIAPMLAPTDAPDTRQPNQTLSQQVAPRRSERQRKPVTRFIEAGLSSLTKDTATTDQQVLPDDGNLTVNQAMRQDSVKASAAILSELRQMLRLGVIERAPSNVNHNVLPSKMFLKWKSASGNIKLKARLVIGGHLQDKATIGETYSPTVCSESVNVVLALASRFGLRPYTIDVSGAFLHVPLQGAALYMRLPKIIVPFLCQLDPVFKSDIDHRGGIIVRIRKAIYGLSESSLQWHQHLSGTLSSIGYAKLRYDRSVFIRRTSTGLPLSVICVHVDDLLVVDFDPACRTPLVESLTSAYGNVTLSTGDDFTYLGVQVQYDGGSLRLNQRPLIDAISYAKPLRDPNNAANDNILASCSAPATNLEAFRSTLMRVLYIATKTRFDLLFPVCILATRQHRCSAQDEAHLAQLVAYLKRTADWSYQLRASSTQLTAAADASYACHPDGRGHSGFACAIGGSTVFARSIKQHLVAKSSAEAELLALNQATDEVIYLRNLLEEIGFPQTGPTTIAQDNQSCIQMANKGELGTKRTKHFNLRHYFVTDAIRAGTISLAYQPGTRILADGLTKPLTGPLGRHWAKTLLGHATGPRRC